MRLDRGRRQSDPAAEPDKAAQYFGWQVALAFGAICALGFLSRGEAPLVSVLGATAIFFGATGWILLAGRVRLWVMYQSGWPTHLQTVAFALALFSPIAMVGLLLQYLAHLAQ